MKNNKKYKKLPKSFYEKKRETITNEQSLKDLVPFDFSEEALSGKRKIKVN